MNSCSAPDPTSIAYLNGSSLGESWLDPQGFCPAIPVTTQGASRLISESLHNMDLEISDIPRAVGAVFRVVALTLSTIAASVFWLLQHCRWILMFVLSPVYWVVSGIARILISPFLIPWWVTVWCWETALDIYEELKPLLIYFSFAILIGALAGSLIVILTNTLVSLLHYYIPFFSPEAERRRRAALASASHRRHSTAHHHQHRGEERTTTKSHHTKEMTGDQSSGSESDTEDEEEEDRWEGPDPISARSRYRMTYPSSTTSGGGVSVARSLRRRAPPAGVRVAATIHEESSG